MGGRNLCHHLVTPEQEALYRFLGDKVTQPELTFDAARYPMPAGWRELVLDREAAMRKLRS